MIDVGHGFGLSSFDQLLHREVVRILEALLRSFLVIVGIVRHNTLQQLVQRVPDAFMVERSHDDALFSRHSYDGVEQHLDVAGMAELGPPNTSLTRPTPLHIVTPSIVAPSYGAQS